MASTYTSRIRLEKQGDGENANTWGLKLNQNVIDLVDEAVAGFETISIDGLSSATLTSNDGTVDQSRNMGLRFTGTLAADCTVVAPSSEKVYFVGNDTIGGHNVVMKSGSASETVYAGSSALVAFDGTNSIKLDGFAPGTRLVFQQTAAPIGWTKDTTNNDKALRITNGTVGSGGSVSFETAFASQTPTGTVGVTVDGHALSVSEMPTHSHFTFSELRSAATITQANLNTSFAPFQQHRGQGSDWAYMMANSNDTADVGKSSETGGNATHTHTASGTFTGTAIDLDVQYIDVIVATKD
jgi:hypothetical protein